MLKYLLFGISGWLVSMIIYGKDVDREEKDGAITILGVLNVVWLLAWVFLFAFKWTAGEIIAVLAVIVGYPALVAVWAFIARWNSNDNVAARLSKKEKERQDAIDKSHFAEMAKEQRKSAFCPSCGALLLEKGHCHKCGAIFEVEQ